jgi:hypothetical protein
MNEERYSHGSSSQFGQWKQPSLGADFDRYAGQMMRAGSQRAQARSAGPAEDQEVSVSMPHIGARRVSHSGHIMNGFAPGATLYGGMGGAYERNRRGVEAGLFDIPRDAPHEERPIYGSLRSKSSEHPSVYGDVTFDLHTGDRRVTTTPGDSLNNFDSWTGSYDERNYTKDDVDDLSIYHRYGDHHPDEEYREVQVHGGPIPLSQVKRATVFRDSLGDLDGTSARETVLELRRQKVPTRIMRHTEYQPTLDQKIFGTGEEGWVNQEAYQPIRWRGLR